MAKQKLMLLLGIVVIALIVVAYIGLTPSTNVGDDTTDDNSNVVDNNPDNSNQTVVDGNTTPVDNTNSTTVTNSTTPDDNTNTLPDDNSVDDTGDNNEPSYPPITSFSSTSVSEALSDNIDDHDDSGDYVWSSSQVVSITLDGNTISADNSAGLVISGSTVTIKSAGTYSISGTLSNGQVVVDTDDTQVVRLILNGVSINCNSNSPLYVKKAEKTVLILADGKENYLTDTANNQDDAALLSKDDLTIYGGGSLTVNAKANDAIRSNNGLLIKSGTITAISVDDGILGRDYLVVKGGDVTVNSVGDGLKSDNLQEPEAGYVLITGGTLKITSSQGDAITAQTDLLISGGTLTLTSGSGSNNTPDENVSTKGLKAVVSIILQGGTVNVNSCDDAVHSNLVVIINNGVCNVASGDEAIAAEKSLTVNSGTVGITKSFDGMKSAEVTINSGYINVVSDDDGISATDFLVIKGGQITVNSVGDGLKTENTEYTTKGYITIQAGTITVTSTKGDAVAAQTDLSIATGTFTLISGGGSSVSPNESISTKGLKGTKTITIDGGTFTVSSSDDAVHSNGVIIINSGTFNLATGDDAIHADTSITVNGGTFTISKCYEGIESSEITINDGYIQIASSDDGINAGEESFGFGMPGPGGSQSTGSNYFLKINGGIIIIDADGDGIDINGYIVMTNGLLVINGPTSNMNGPIDYNQYFQISGGTVVASGSSGMAQAPSTGSQRSVLVRFTNVQQANTLITIQTASGETVLTFRPTKMFQSLAFSSSELVAGSYVVYLGGSSTGVPTYGIYEGGIYTPGTQVRTFNVN